jgi:hypothetical protein
MKDYVIAKITFGGGFLVTLADYLQFGTIILGFLGSICMFGGAVYYLNIKKIEKEIKEIELKKLKSEDLS